MCGIAGIYAESGPPPGRHELERMIACLVHRGPDGEGVWQEGRVGFGHRRLSIIDLAGGAQPMESASGRLVITYNGEIYNYRELRTQLAREGFRFHTASDTEVILALIEQRGLSGLASLRGMFAFAIWDRAERRLLLARDHLGIKPLFLSRTGGRLFFASEIKALRAALPVTPSLDPAAVNAYFLRQYIGGPHTIFHGIESLPPGTALEITPSSTKSHRYWHPPEHTRGPEDSSTAVREVHASLDRAVKRHLVSDVPVGVFLSGGIDSTCLLAFAARHSPDPVMTFSVGFGEEGVSELPFARTAASRFAAVHHEVPVSAEEGLRNLPAIIRSLGQPLADYAIVPTYIMSRFAAQRVKVVLGGEGADELFGGYNRYARYAFLDLFCRPWALGRRLPLPRPPAPLFGDAERRALLGDAFVPRRDLPSEQKLARDLRESRGAGGAVNAALYSDLNNWLGDDLLAKVDRMGMLASLEARVPYLDLDLVERVLALPGRFKVGIRSRKRILREIARPWVPGEILQRPKQGFTVPVERWLVGPLRDRFEDVALSEGTGPDGWLRRSRIERLWRQLPYGRGRRVALGIWSILIFRWWYEEHVR